MNWKDLKDNRKFIILSLSAVGCITVVVYLMLKHFGLVLSALGVFIGFFREVLIGGILAYLINPIALTIKKKVFKRSKMKDGGWALSVTAALIIVLFLHYDLYVFINNRQSGGNTDEYVLFLTLALFICIYLFSRKIVVFGVLGGQKRGQKKGLQMAYFRYASEIDKEKNKRFLPN